MNVFSLWCMLSGRSALLNKEQITLKSPPMLPSGGLGKDPKSLFKKLTLVQRLDVALGRASEELARTANLVLGVANHFIELGNPA